MAHFEVRKLETQWLRVRSLDGFQWFRAEHFKRTRDRIAERIVVEADPFLGHGYSASEQINFPSEICFSFARRLEFLFDGRTLLRVDSGVLDLLDLLFNFGTSDAGTNGFMEPLFQNFCEATQ